MAAPSKHRFVGIFEIENSIRARAFVQPVAHRGLVTAMALESGQHPTDQRGIGWNDPRLFGGVRLEIQDQGQFVWRDPCAGLGTLGKRGSDQGGIRGHPFGRGGWHAAGLVVHPESDVSVPEENWVTAAQWSRRAKPSRAARFSITLIFSSCSPANSSRFPLTHRRGSTTSHGLLSGERDGNGFPFRESTGGIRCRGWPSHWTLSHAGTGARLLESVGRNDRRMWARRCAVLGSENGASGLGHSRGLR